jgi:hypothetical protein
MSRLSMWVSCYQRLIAMLVSSAPLSETTLKGQPRSPMSASSSRLTRIPDSDRIGHQAEAFTGVNSSTTTRILNRRL